MPSSKKPLRYEGVENRVQVVALLMTLAFSLLCVQFWRLQVVLLSEFTEMAEENRVWPKRLKSDRGIIYGRDNVILADNRASADIVLVPGDCTPEERRGEVCQLLERLVGVSGDTVIQRIKEHKSDPFTQILVKRDVTKADRIQVEEHTYALPGVFVVAHPQRRYLHGDTAGQILGYVGEIGRQELAAWKDEGYYLGDLIGRGGVERMYEKRLHGADGYMVVTKYATGRPQLRTDKRGMPFIAQRDSRGHMLSEEEGRRKDPLSGNPLHLTLDVGLQAKCESLLHGEVGAIAVLEAETGAVLALASVPTYNPSVFVTRGRGRERMELLTAEEPNPMLNRALRENYPPGSVFKVMLASAALEAGAITKETSFFCPGYYQIGGKGRKWRCWKRSGHGHVKVVEALAFSCDVFFYNVGLKLGIDGINEWAARFGLGERTGIDLPKEVPGLIPTRDWKERIFAHKPVWDRRWFPGDTVNVSIGQGSVNTTPLQNAVMMACIVNGGYRVRPYLNLDIGPQLSDRFLSQGTIALVHQGMQLCVEKGPPAPTGTGHAAHIPGFTTLGKTGSAQIMSLEHHKKYEEEEDIPKEFRDHAWFVAGVMNREPKIALCILVEHGHHGSSAAAPLAKEVIEYFYAREAAGTALARGGIE